MVEEWNNDSLRGFDFQIYNIIIIRILHIGLLFGVAHEYCALEADLLLCEANH
jgi:hypothetical protein